MSDYIVLALVNAQIILNSEHLQVTGMKEVTALRGLSEEFAPGRKSHWLSSNL